MDEGETRTALLSVVVAEFTALRAEIDRRSGAQDRLFALNLAIAGAVGGILARGELAPEWDVRLLYLILPAVTPALALGWWDHAGNISELGKHIGSALRSAVVELSGADEHLSNDVLRWEGRTRSMSRARAVALGLQLLVPFVLFPGVSLVAFALELGWTADGLWLLVCALAAFIALVTWRLVKFMLGSTQRADPARHQ